VRLSIETGLGAGVYSLGVKSVLYISPLLKSKFLKSPQFNPQKCLRAAPLRGAETNMPPPVPGGETPVARVKRCPPKIT
jgi:hypothetical protein